mgnify:CR=1 FL=1
MKKKLGILVAAEAIGMVLAVLLSINHFHKREAVFQYGQDDFQCFAGNSDSGFYVDAGMGDFKDIRIGIPGAELPEGSYLVDVEYQAKGVAHLAVNYSHGKGDYDLSGNIVLSDIESHKRFDIMVDGKEGPVAVFGRLNSECSEGDYLLLLGVTVTSTFAWYRIRLTGLFLLLALFDVCIWLYSMRREIYFPVEKRKALAGVCLIAFVACIPLMTNYLFKQQDMIFHINRIEGIKEGLQAGDFPVRIQPHWLNGHGYPVSVFYGDFWLYIPALLRLAGLPVQSCYKMFIVLANFATAGISYICFRKMSGSRRAGLAAASLYTLNLYRLTNVYVRSAVGEFTAMVFFPLILFGLWSIFTGSPEKVKKGNVWMILSFGYLGVLFSHLISCEMIGLFTIFACILQIRKVLIKERFLELLKALTGLVIGGIWFWLPLLEYMQLDFLSSDMDRFSIYRQQERGMFWAQFFSTRYNVNGESQTVAMGMTGEMPLTLGIAFLLILLAAVYVSICCWKGIKNKKEWMAGMLLTGLSVWMCTKDFPFRWLAEKLGFTKLLINSLQFPWRFLAVAALLCIWLFLMILRNTELGEKEKGIFSVAVCMVLLINGMDLMSEVMSNAAVTRIFDGRVISSFGVGGGEYMFSGYQMEDYVSGITDMGAGVEVAGWEKNGNEADLQVTNNSGEEQTLELPLILYKGYRAEDTRTGGGMELSNGKSHRAILHLPGGYAGSVKIKFVEPWYWRAAELISLAGYIGAAVLFARSRRKAVN